MAERITRQDIGKVISLVHVIGPQDMTRDHRSFTTDDQWQVLIGGWSHGPKFRWCRGYMISDLRHEEGGPSRGHVSPADDEGDYDGPGWHRRMALDILKDLAELRLSAEVKP